MLQCYYIYAYLNLTNDQVNYKIIAHIGGFAEKVNSSRENKIFPKPDIINSRIAPIQERA